MQSKSSAEVAADALARLESAGGAYIVLLPGGVTPEVAGQVVRSVLSAAVEALVEVSPKGTHHLCVTGAGPEDLGPESDLGKWLRGRMVELAALPGAVFDLGTYGDPVSPSGECECRQCRRLRERGKAGGHVH